MSSRSKISLVIPVYNEEDNLPEVFKRLDPIQSALKAHGISVEMVIVDDHSQDSTPQVAKSLVAAQPNARYLRLSRNSGAHLACAAGLEHCTGDAAIIMAADLQDPPELIPELTAAWSEGIDVVWAVRAGRVGESWTTLVTSRVFNWLMRSSFGDLPSQGADVVLVSRRVIDAYNAMREKNANINLAIRWLGFRQTSIKYVKEARHSGTSRFTLAKKIKVFIDSVVGYSYAPLRAVSVLGIAMILTGFLMGMVGIVVGFLAGFAMGSWFVIIVSILLCGQGGVLVALGILGEYTWRALDEVRGRPLYLIEDATGLIAQSSEAPEPACETAFGPEAPVAQHETWAKT
jgi:glycosyltransferase involved in cell wall biosynthesis